MLFSFYVKFPENRWDEIKIAEKSTTEGEKMFKKLGEEFDRQWTERRAEYEARRLG